MTVLIRMSSDATETADLIVRRVTFHPFCSDVSLVVFARQSPRDWYPADYVQSSFFSTSLLVTRVYTTFGVGDGVSISNETTCKSFAVPT